MPKVHPYLRDKVKAAVDETSYKDVADMIGLSAATVFHIYNGREICRKSTWQKLTAKLGRPPKTNVNAVTGAQQEREFPGAHLPPHPFVLSVDFPEQQFIDDLQRTEKLSMTGTNLRRHDKRREIIDDFLVQGGTIDALLIDPRSSARRFAAFQEHGNESQKSVAAFLAHLKSSREWLCGLKTQENNKYYERVDIKKIAYPLCFGMDVLDFYGGGGVVFLRFYPLMINQEEKDRPIIEIRDDNKDWYFFFRAQLDRHISRAESWNCPRTRDRK